MRFITKHQADRIETRFRFLYGDAAAPRLLKRFYMMLGRYGIGLDVPEAGPVWGADEVVLITYADSIQRAGDRPLQALRAFVCEHLRGLVQTVHILPFYPWSSDDGFSVIDYRQVDPRYGTWDDIRALRKEFDLMFDLVLNHGSRHSTWFREFVTGIAPARDYYHVVPKDADVSSVVRPRESPLLTRTATHEGDVYVWTTFSADQVDFNWANPDVLFEFLDILFLYLNRGARFLRLDAVAFLWKILGTSCLHLPQTHEVVKLFRDVIELVAPDTRLLTETNVPHDENISYFGEGDEAHLVYNFSLPPLLLHGLLREDSTHLATWARTLPALPPGQGFFNFTASHDGIGVRPLSGLVAPGELDWLIEQVTERGGEVSFREKDGHSVPYELNITYLDALRVPGDDALSRERFLCSQAVALAWRGIPALYINSLVGTENFAEGFRQSGHKRTLNRRKWAWEDLQVALNEPDKPQAQIFSRYLTLLKRRLGHPAFHPDAAMRILDLGPKVFGFLRHSDIPQEHIACLFNFSREPQTVAFADIDPVFTESGGQARGLLTGSTYKTGPRRTLELAPFQAVWLLKKQPTDNGNGA